MDSNVLHGIFTHRENIKLDGKHIVLNDGTANGYPIPLSDIKNNPVGTLRWILHINEKRWVNNFHISGLIIASKVNIYG